MVNVEQNRESLNSLDTVKELNDLKREIESGNFDESLNSMKENKELVDAVLEKVNVLKNKELELKEASEYRDLLADYANKLSNYSESMKESIGGIESTIKFGKPDKKKINKYLEESNAFANDARDIEGKLKEMEKDIKNLKKVQDLEDQLDGLRDQKKEEEQKKKEEEKKRKEAERKRKEEKARNDFWLDAANTRASSETQDYETYENEESYENVPSDSMMLNAIQSMGMFMNPKNLNVNLSIPPYHFETVKWGMNRKPDVQVVVDKIKPLRKDIKATIDSYLTKNPADVKGLQKYLNECIAYEDASGRRMINRKRLKALTDDKGMPLVYRPGKKPEFQIREDGKFGPQTFAVILSFEERCYA